MSTMATYGGAAEDESIDDVCMNADLCQSSPLFPSFNFGGGSVHVPVMLWGSQPPPHPITVIRCLPDDSAIFTGASDGQIVIWKRNSSDKAYYPQFMLYGHNHAISALSPTAKSVPCHSFVSVDKSGHICLWDSDDGRCLQSQPSKNLHTELHPHSLKVDSTVSRVRMFCVGQYPEIMVMDPEDLQILFCLSSRVEQDWITSLCLLKPPNRPDICIALSQAGMVKIWSLTDVDNRDACNPVYEDESKQVRSEASILLTACPFNQRQMMIIARQSWQVYDASDFSVLVSAASPKGQTWVAGCFTRIDKVAVACSDGAVYLYQLPRSALRGKAVSAILGQSPAELVQGDAAVCYCVMKNTSDVVMRSAICSRPSFYLHRSPSNAQRMSIYRGDRSGAVWVWQVPDVPDKTIAALQQEQFDSCPTLPPESVQSLQLAWTLLQHTPADIVGHLESDKRSAVQCTLYVARQGRLFLGRADGSILMLAAAHTLIRQLLNTNTLHKSKDSASVRVLMGHTEAVTCLLYPHDEHPRYEPAHFLSGAQDFSVLLWDLNTGTRLNKFCVQAGPVTRLLCPPAGCSSRVLGCVCSVAKDHSVALISLKESKCILLASRHIYPVMDIKWRPLDDYMLVQCEDSSVYVWQMETASLDRVISGLCAEEVLLASEEQMQAECMFNQSEQQAGSGNAAGASNAVQMLRAIKHKNIDVVKRIAADALNDKDAQILQEPELLPPMHVHGLPVTEHNTQQAHLLTFNLEALIVGLLREEQLCQAGMSSNTSEAGESRTSTAEPVRVHSDTSAASLHGLLNIAREKADKVLQLSPATQRKHAKDTSKKPQVAGVAEGQLCMDAAQLLMSLLYAWNMDNDLDQVCVRKLGLLRPRLPVCFGLISKHGHVSVMLPPGVDVPTTNTTSTRTQAQPNEHMTSDSDSDSAHAFNVFASTVHWQLSPAVSTVHLLTITSLANTLITLQQGAFLPDHSTKRCVLRRMSSISPAVAETEQKKSQTEQWQADQAQLKQGWSLLSAMHCVLLPELVTIGQYQAPQMDQLVMRWQDRCVPVRQATQALLLRELNRLGSDARRKLVDYWAQFLPTKLDPSLNIFGRPVATSVTAVVANTAPDEQAKMGPNASVFTPLEPVSYVSGEACIRALRRNQAVAILLLSVVGAEFGQEMAAPQSVPPALPSQHGFSDKDTSLAFATSQCLVELLVQPASAVLPAFSALRSAGVDLLGRGFVVWQPYLDISKVLLALLELTANADKLLPTVPGQAHGQGQGAADCIYPLCAEADACRTARSTLSLIALARPSAFLTALSKEVARYNAAAQHQTLQHSVTSPLLKSRHEVLRLIELLVDKQYNEVAEHMLPVGDILVHCLDTSLLKHKSLNDVFAPISKFGMVSYCANSRRIAFGGKNGVLVIHELRAAKCMTINAHTRAVTACALAEDGKHMATYSAEEAKLNFWQTSASFLGMGQSSVKCVKQVPAPPMQQPVCTPNGTQPQHARAKIVWIGAKAVTLMLPNGKEHRFAL